MISTATRASLLAQSLRNCIELYHQDVESLSAEIRERFQNDPTAGEIMRLIVRDDLEGQGDLVANALWVLIR